MPAQSTLLLPEGYSDNRLVSDLTRRQFGFGAGIAGLGAFLAACGDSGSSPGEAEMRSVTTPLGTYDIPVNPKRVVAVDSRLDLEPAVALELPLVGYTYAQATPWVPIDSSVPFLSEIPNREQILALEPDLIVCLNYESEWWPVAEMSTIAPVLTTEFTDDWRTNLSRLSGWLGRTATLDRLTLDYDNLISDIRSRHAEKIASKTVASVSFMPDTNTLYVTSIRTSEKGDKPSDMTLGDIGGKTATSEGLDPEGGVSLEGLGVLAGVDGFMITENEDSAAYQALVASKLWQRLPAVQAGNVTSLGGSTFYGSIYTISYVAQGWDALYNKIS